MTFESKGEGSGSVIDRQGHVLTDYHVVEAATNPRRTFRRHTYDAKLVGGDVETDIAVLKIDAPPEALPRSPSAVRRTSWSVNGAYA